MNWLWKEVSKKAINSISIEFLLNRANTRAEEGNYQGAIEDYNQVLRINPNEDAAYSNRGSILAGIGEHEAAIQDYTQALRLNPFEAAPYYNRGISRAAIGDYIGAIQDY
ncbi:MAG: tetratricopeptide repeat protein, partial [Trichormus sp.]